MTKATLQQKYLQK